MKKSNKRPKVGMRYKNKRDSTFNIIIEEIIGSVIYYRDEADWGVYQITVNDFPLFFELVYEIEGFEV